MAACVAKSSSSKKNLLEAMRKKEHTRAIFESLFKSRNFQKEFLVEVGQMTSTEIGVIGEGLHRFL